MIDTDLDTLKFIMALISGSSYDKGRANVFKDDIDNKKFQEWRDKHIDDLIHAAGIEEV